MIRNLLIAICTVGLLASCASKKKTDDNAAGELGSDAKISNQDMAFDSQGSDSGKIPGLYTIHFDFDQSRLTSEARRLLADNAAWIKARPGQSVQIEGHTDERGSIEYNLALGERRARSVKEYLVSLGVEAKSLSIISFGEEKPIVQGSDDEAYSKNRRANFVPLAR